MDRKGAVVPSNLLTLEDARAVKRSRSRNVPARLSFNSLRGSGRMVSEARALPTHLGYPA